jgi:hypothetical protein
MPYISDAELEMRINLERSDAKNNGVAVGLILGIFIASVWIIWLGIVKVFP